MRVRSNERERGRESENRENKKTTSSKGFSKQNDQLLYVNLISPQVNQINYLSKKLSESGNLNTDWVFDKMKKIRLLFKR